MSMDVSIGVAIGFQFDTGCFADLFGEEVGEKSRLEPRWDGKTGKRLKDVKVVTRPAQVVCKFDGKTYSTDEWEDLAKRIAAKARCTAHISVDHDGSGLVVFGPKLPSETCSSTTILDGAVWVDGAMPLDAFLKFGPQIRKIGVSLKKLGLKPGKPVVRVSYVA